MDENETPRKPGGEEEERNAERDTQRLYQRKSPGENQGDQGEEEENENGHEEDAAHTCGILGVAEQYSSSPSP